jgi:hypothetical protein
MKYVEIYKLGNDGSQKVTLRCFLNDAGIVEITGENEQLAKNLVRAGIKNYLQETPKTLFPTNGLHFLQNMKYYFTSGYLNASDVMNL